MLRVTCYIVYIIYYMLRVTFLPIRCYVLHFYLLHDMCYILHVTRCMLRVYCYIVCVTWYMQVLLVICYM